MHTSYIVTFTSDDRPGLVEQLSRVIENNGGNWHESRLSQLGGMFAGLILVSLPSDGAPALETGSARWFWDDFAGYRGWPRTIL